MKNEIYRFSVLPLSVTGSEGFTDATTEELRVLLALIEKNGIADTASLAEAAKVSQQRTASAVVFWKEAGVLSDTGCPEEAKTEPDAPAVTEEFEERLLPGTLIPEARTKIAETIRDHQLADLFKEITALLDERNRVSLNDEEVRRVAGLVSQYGLSEEYILSLASYLAESGKLTVTKLFNKAVELCKKDVETPERLAEYIKECENTPEYVFEMKKLFKLYDTTVSKSQRAFFDRWYLTYGFDLSVIGEAYDIASVNVDKKSSYFSYMDTILCGWHDAGLTTAEECRKKAQEDRAALAGKYKKENRSSTKKNAAKVTEGFDPEDALARALERSFAFMDDEENKEAPHG